MDVAAARSGPEIETRPGSLAKGICQRRSGNRPVAASESRSRIRRASRSAGSSRGLIVQSAAAMFARAGGREPSDGA
jgi:hypothetical protein